ncbi:MAG: peptide chain release factor N(5)-glutamine methyltransferase [Flexibacter sp. CG_4_10_14_3_um_filter_32_15]|nr:MAG: peptide chain release factor N(5)-glutamine methyltransferase [Flexibacter sp. CG_4_10_14_3_um_filter_32_15]
MLISEYIKINAISLTSTHQIDERESQTLLRFLIEDSLQINRIDFSNYILKKQEIDFLNKSVERLKNNEPLQYITNKAYFYGLEFEVNPAVLIPRPETEELVHQVLKDFETKNKEKHTFLEVGTGSGCISITLAKNLPYCNFIAIDISKKALEIAKRNAQKNNVKNIEFIELDFLNEKLSEELYSNYPKLQSINSLISNPPYIKESEKLQMSKNVLDYEPRIALFVEEDNPLIFYKALANFFVNTIKNKDGLFYVEINQYLANETKDLFMSFGIENCIVFKDLQENSRFIRASHK